MKKKRVKGFTLIELIAVLVILAILAFIVVPLVMNIVKKAKDAANKRSVDAYGKALDLDVATYLLDYGQYPSSLDNLTIEYSGSEVTCLTKTINNDGSIYLSGCSVKNTDVLDSNNSDGYYHYGQNGQNSIVTDNDSSFEIGDMVSYHGIEFYVIEDSDVKYVVDNWSDDNLSSSDLNAATRLITLDELRNNLGYGGSDGATYYPKNISVPSWACSIYIPYWAMTPYDSRLYVWHVRGAGISSNYYQIFNLDVAVRPVVTIYKSALSN